MEAVSDAQKNLSPCDVAALQKCLEENKGDHKKCLEEVQAFQRACSKPKPQTSQQNSTT